MHKEDSCEEVIRRNSDLVYRLAFSLVKSGADADDIYQDVFMQYIKRGPVFESHEHEKAWFVRVTVNRCKNHWKSPWVRRRAAYWETAVSCDAGQCAKDGSVLDTSAVAVVGTDMETEENRKLIETVKRLPEKYRVVIHLFYYEEMSVEEIGKATGSRASTVRTRLTRARRILKDQLGGL